MSDMEDFDYAAAIANMVPLPGQTLEGRRAKEKQKLSAADRRAIQTTGRTEQLNLKVRPMMKVEFMQRAEAEGIKPTELFEKAWDLYKATRGI